MNLGSTPAREPSARPAARRLGGRVAGHGDHGGAHPAVRHTASAVDACHPGIVLRAVLVVHGVVALGIALAVDGSAAAWPLLATASATALPAVLLWLGLVCAAGRRAGRWPTGLRWAFAAACGAGSAVLARLGSGWLSGADVGIALPAHRLVATAAAGAAFGAMIFAWLEQRRRLQLPATTAARLAELQSRIRPHFLFNTLNTAIALARTDPLRTEAVLEDLAELFRVALNDAQAEASASLHDELELARRYLAIEQIRFGDRLRIEWDIDPAAGAARVPLLLLQPLVENAVRHGVEPAAAGGLLRVCTRVRHGQAEVAVTNSVTADPSQPGRGMALANVRERLQLMHDVAAEFRAGRAGDVYRVHLVLPLP